MPIREETIIEIHMGRDILETWLNEPCIANTYGSCEKRPVIMLSSVALAWKSRE